MKSKTLGREIQAFHVKISSKIQGIEANSCGNSGGKWPWNICSDYWHRPQLYYQIFDQSQALFHSTYFIQYLRCLDFIFAIALHAWLHFVFIYILSIFSTFWGMGVLQKVLFVQKYFFFFQSCRTCCSLCAQSAASLSSPALRVAFDKPCFHFIFINLLNLSGKTSLVTTNMKVQMAH